MRSRSDGQSLLEMAFVLPILLIIVFGIIEFGYLIYAYSTVSQAARNGAEAAAQLPPYETWLNYRTAPPAAADYPGLTGDACVRGIYRAIESDTTLFNGDVNAGRRIIDSVVISYPNGGQTRNLKDRGPIQVQISYRVQGLTPLFQLLRIGGSDGSITLTVTQRRSIENLGVDPTKPTGVACAEDIANWRDMNDFPSP